VGCGRCDVTCGRCRRREAVGNRRSVSSVSTWTAPVPVCGECADFLDGLAEKCSRGAIFVDTVVRRYRTRANLQEAA
jgi:hypothetical protein